MQASQVSRSAILRVNLAILLLGAAALHAQGATAAPQSDLYIQSVVSSLEEARGIVQTALSPDGSRIAWVVAEYGGAGIEVASTSDLSRFYRLTAGSGQACVETNLAWAPDSQALAFTSDCREDAQADLYLAAFAAHSDSPAVASPARRLTHLHGAVNSLAFSPDGKRIGFLYVENATRRPGALDAMKPPAGVIGVEGLEIQRVASVVLASGETEQITPADLHVYEFDWAPDSQRIAYIAAPPPGENNWWVAELYTQALSAATPRSIFDPSQTLGPLHGLQIAVSRWSPDGSQIAFIGGLMSDQGATGGDLYVLPALGGEARDLTPNRQATPVWFRWMGVASGGETPASGWFELVEIKDGVMRRTAIDQQGNDVRNQQESFDGEAGDGSIEGALSTSSDQTAFAYILSSFAHPPEVMLTRKRGPEWETVQVTHLNGQVKPAWGKSESLAWSNDNLHVQGWLLYPANYDPASKYPLIVSVHGGPSSAVVPRWPSLGYNAIAFSALGYFVLMPNPRGSYGEGEAFTQANRKDFGYGDLRDILAGVDAAAASFPIDQRRIGITGWSYGGFMTMFAVTQTQRFHAAVAGAGISNWQSYYGENSIDQWMIPFFGSSVYDAPSIYAKSSAIDFIRNAKTPTLVVVGDRDGECPAPQSFEFWHALRAEHVPTRLVVYPGEGHRFSSPEHRRDVLERALSWFEQYLPTGEDDGQPAGR